MIRTQTGARSLWSKSGKNLGRPLVPVHARARLSSFLGTEGGWEGHFSCRGGARRGRTWGIRTKPEEQESGKGNPQKLMRAGRAGGGRRRAGYSDRDCRRRCRTESSLFLDVHMMDWLSGDLVLSPIHHLGQVICFL